MRDGDEQHAAEQSLLGPVLDIPHGYAIRGCNTVNDALRCLRLSASIRLLLTDEISQKGQS